MNIYIDNHKFHYEIENLTKAFLPNEKLFVIPFDGTLSQPYILTSYRDEIKVSVIANGFEKTLTKEIVKGQDDELVMATLLYDILSEMLSINLPWGLLTGVRPIKLFHKLVSQYGEEGAISYFENELKVSKKKTSLALSCEKAQRDILSLSKPNSFSLYISIPFCPTRCNYCSFVSQSVEKAKHLVKDYLRLLCDEIKETAKIANELSLDLQSVYIGGGTPTTLSAEQLKILLDTVNENFDVSGCEFTVEAGRPDTVTPDKLLCLKDCGVTRISINPQTLNDSVLEAIGRRHTTKQTLNAYSLAKEMGFDNINMDLIAGLTTDTLDSFKDTVDKVIKLSPQSITVHTLAIKRSANINDETLCIDKSSANVTKTMLDYAQKALYDNGYVPYYLYRQSKMVGNLENVGWAKEGFFSPYNVFIMDEVHTILGCGAGAVTKLKNPYSNYIERIFNFKYPYEYNSRYSELLTRKEKIKEFYSDIFNTNKGE